MSVPMSTILWVSRLPALFQEYELRGFFSQFGDIKRLRLVRSQRTGNSKHFAYVQFGDLDTAAITAATMNGYLLQGRALVVKQLTAAEEASMNVFRRVPMLREQRQADFAAAHARTLDEEEIAEYAALREARKAEKRERLATLGFGGIFDIIFAEKPAVEEKVVEEPKKAKKQAKVEAVKPKVEAAKQHKAKVAHKGKK